MLALASLATGFVVAAVTPSHGAADHRSLGDPTVGDAVSAPDRTVAGDSPDAEAVPDRA